MALDSAIKKIIFLTGTRADFGKLKALMLKLDSKDKFEIHVFITGMHMLSKYGYTCTEVERIGIKNIYKFINQSANDTMECVLAKTITGLSDYVKEISPDLIIVHGDRVEALAGAAVGALNNILVGHIEGGEVSGTVDELIRHSVSKLSHVHFVANDLAKKRIIQLGEIPDSIHIIGSPDVDVMNSDSLPSIAEVRSRYGLCYDKYSILMFHPVTTEVKELHNQIKTVVDEVIASEKNYIVIYPNNDHGSNIILREYARLEKLENIKIFPSMRFEYFLTLLKNADYIIGNSSAGVREAPHFGVPAINLGTRQQNRVKCSLVIDTAFDSIQIKEAIARSDQLIRTPQALFGNGNSANQFCEILDSSKFWNIDKQKHFVDWK